MLFDTKQGTLAPTPLKMQDAETKELAERAFRIYFILKEMGSSKFDPFFGSGYEEYASPNLKPRKKKSGSWWLPRSEHSYVRVKYNRK
jgi:hypothetical protein